jgi:RimJ/RimL family protein N-acetyltransferase
MVQQMIDIKPYKELDWPSVWHIIEPVFRAGETYPYPPDISEKEAHLAWIEAPAATFVAVDANNDILGTYYIKTNQPGLGAHVCNCGYITAGEARGQGIASAMCVHSQDEAVDRSFRAMQYNLVVSTNEGAINLWKRHGFEVVGRLPQAFQHTQFGFVDAIVMYKLLSP